MNTNRIKSGPGPLRVIYEKISALENEVHELKSQLRLVHRKLNNYERNSSVSVKDVLLDRIREQPFTLTLTPASEDSINIVQPYQRQGQLTTRIRNSTGNQISRNIRVNHNQRTLDESPTIVPDNMDDDMEQQESDAANNYEIEGDEKPISMNNVEIASSPNQNPGSDKKKIKSKKPLDPIWNEYKISISSNGTRQATCRLCDRSISGKADRLRKHFYQRCPGTPRTGSRNNISTHTMPGSTNSTEATSEEINYPNSSNSSTPSTKRKRNDLDYSEHNDEDDFDPFGKEG